MKKIVNNFLMIWKAIIKCWLPYLKQNPSGIFRFPKWLITQYPGIYPKAKPWFIYEAIEWLDKYLTKDMIVFEWGSGGSTNWIARRVKEMITVESDEKWFKKIRKVGNCTYIYCPQETNEMIDQYPDNCFDLIIVDGIPEEREKCFELAINKVKIGGYILLDDCENKEVAGFQTTYFRGIKDYTCACKPTAIFKKL